MTAARRLGGPAAAVVGLALVARLLYGPGFVTVDPMWALAWGDQIEHGVSPSVSAPAASTSHPLADLVGAVLAVFGSGAEPILVAIGFLAIGVIGLAVFRLARLWFGLAAGVVAVALTLTRPAFASFGRLAVIDIPFCALVLSAAAVEARRPRAGVPVLGLLAVAGLARPEAWFLAGLYWLWLWRGSSLREASRTLPLVAAGPVTWLAVDWALTGEPLFSLTYTREAATRYGRVTGIHGLLTEGVHVLGYELRPTVLLAAVLGFALAWRDRRVRRLLAVTGAVAVSVAIPVAAGTPLNGRYLVVVLALCCVAAAAAITLPLRRRGAPAIALAAVAGLAVLVGIPDLADRVDGTRDDLTVIAHAHDDARSLVAGGLPCRPVTVTGLLARPAVAVWTGVPLERVTDPDLVRPDHGTFLIGTPVAAQSFTVLDTVLAPGAPPVRAPAGARVVARRGGWTLLARC